MTTIQLRRQVKAWKKLPHKDVTHSNEQLEFDKAKSFVKLRMFAHLAGFHVAKRHYFIGQTQSIWEDGDSQFVKFSKKFLRKMNEKDRSRRRYESKRISSINVEDAKALAVGVFCEGITVKGLPWGTKNPKPQWKDFFKNMGITHVANK